ncbi:2-amino-4-hydroxy-6-hydroxymethyldihydropteridine pyrophosphokinase [Candidatus Syntrophocurvum alkaliphilum]|uniref:2-amino-4-hydroxy-6-hydroxymethyldihydropteridine diphosphokinase n=1 Tax=Candidatus Syntrophocurvum alkaliphilum TaxID=2293317 RepID=A0A6I6DMT0_9FIRM|nr:2-amino-4-hydroxy-6-hydroxymethyldihydropteridine diphosphokinase [Candidatus Syntrophocurvum alkaliphilum]QGU00511.1 2-amino-4-hydroxy-6-hydroxymethyldihydropteridine pyrophosphokinase [Candidatus Syntrophocurvum alkaliphilum]
MQQTSYISLGSNIGDKIENLNKSISEISKINGVDITNCSSLYITKPWGKTDQDDFINQVIEIKTDIKPLKLLYKFQNIEINMGRQRSIKWGPRIIDIDILLYGEQSIDSEELKVPHPLMLKRLFVLYPLWEIAPELILPNGTRIKEVLDRVLTREGGNSITKI